MTIPPTVDGQEHDAGVLQLSATSSTELLPDASRSAGLTLPSHRPMSTALEYLRLCHSGEKTLTPLSVHSGQSSPWTSRSSLRDAMCCFSQHGSSRQGLVCRHCRLTSQRGCRRECCCMAFASRASSALFEKLRTAYRIGRSQRAWIS